VTISDAPSPADEIENLKARHAAEIARIVEVAQETVEKLVQEALEDADRRIDQLKADPTIDGGDLGWPPRQQCRDQHQFRMDDAARVGWRLSLARSSTR
jgi:cell division septum initiation protein DivIVA